MLIGTGAGNSDYHRRLLLINAPPCAYCTICRPCTVTPPTPRTQQKPRGPGREAFAVPCSSVSGDLVGGSQVEAAWALPHWRGHHGVRERSPLPLALDRRGADAGAAGEPAL
jgi:hypothetical protein